jgi:hypothetical protein
LSCPRLTPLTAGLFEIYSARPGADLFRRPSPRRRVDNPAAHHLRIRDRAVRRRRRRFLPAHHRCHPSKRPPRASRAARRHGSRAGLDGHASAGGLRVGVAQLEVPTRGPCRGHDLRPVDADPEAGSRRGFVHGNRGVARGCPHRRRSPLRRRRGGSKRVARPPGPHRRTRFQRAHGGAGSGSNVQRDHPAAWSAAPPLYR